MLREIPAVDLSNLVSQAHGKPGDITSRGSSVVDLVFQSVHLRFCHTGFEYTVEVVIRSVVMNRITAKISQLVHIPGGIVRVGEETVPDISGGNLFVSAAPAKPQAQIADDQNRLGKRNIQIDAFIGQIITIISDILFGERPPFPSILPFCNLRETNCSIRDVLILLIGYLPRSGLMWFSIVFL